MQNQLIKNVHVAVKYSLAPSNIFTRTTQAQQALVLGVLSVTE